jgi:hypothetical protein
LSVANLYSGAALRASVSSTTKPPDMPSWWALAYACHLVQTSGDRFDGRSHLSLSANMLSGIKFHATDFFVDDNKPLMI